MMFATRRTGDGGCCARAGSLFRVFIAALIESLSSRLSRYECIWVCFAPERL